MQLPLEEDIIKLRNYINRRIKDITTDAFLMWDSSTYIELRDATCARLTLFNARRGGEPARMLLTEWDAAKSGTWIDAQRVKDIDDPIEKFLLASIKVTYQMGKKEEFQIGPCLNSERYTKGTWFAGR